jgi:hypothetical protein
MEGSIRKSPGFSRFGIYRKQGGKSAKRWALNGSVNTLRELSRNNLLNLAQNFFR